MRRIIPLAALLACCLTLAACTASQAPSTGAAPSASLTESVAPGDIPDTQAYVQVTAPDGKWRLKVPEGWSQRTTATGVALTDKFNGITAEEQAAASAPTTSSVVGAEVARLSAATPGFTQRSIETFTRQGGSGVLVRYEYDSAKDPVTERVHRQHAELYLFHQGGREVLLTLTGAVGSDNVDPWKIISDSFRWTA